MSVVSDLNKSMIRATRIRATVLPIRHKSAPSTTLLNIPAAVTTDISGMVRNAQFFPNAAQPAELRAKIRQAD